MSQLENSPGEFDALCRYLAVDPDNLELLAAAIDAALKEGRASDALPHVEHALQLRPDHPQFAYRRAVALRYAGQPAAAEQALYGLLSQGVRHPVLLQELADLHLHQRDYARCVEVLEQLMALPDAAAIATRADLLLVRALHHLGRLDEAIAHAQAALARQPGRADLQAALATLLLDADRQDEAVHLYALALQQGTLNPELECVGGYLALQAEDLGKAQAGFARALAGAPSDGRSLLGAGLCAAALGQLPDAESQLRQAAQAMPSHLGTWNALAWVQLLSGRLDTAESTLRHANEVDRNFAENHGGLAVIAAMKGDEARARELIRTAFKLDPDCYSAAYASVLLQAGANGQAVVLDGVMQALARRPDKAGRPLQESVLRMVAKAAASR